MTTRRVWGRCHPRAHAGALSFALACALGGNALHAHAELGRLFLTPQQRAELDRRRATGAVETQPIVVQESAVTLNGYVARSDGRATTWVNGVPRYNARPPRGDGRVTLNEPAGQVSLKAGQSADLVGGGVRDPLGGGSVRAKATAGDGR